MQSDYKEIKDTHELILHLLSISFFYGDYSIPFHFMNPSSNVVLAAQKSDIISMHSFASRNWVNFELFSAEKKEQLEKTYADTTKAYSDQIKKQLTPLPPKYLIDLGKRAIELGHFRDAFSAYSAVNELDKHVNEFIVKAEEILKSKKVTSSESDVELEKEISQAVSFIYKATKLKNPLGNQFQQLGQNLHYRNIESFRKLNKYIENNLLKEIIDFSIHYLIDNNHIADKASKALLTGKVRKIFLRHLCEKFSGGHDKFTNFVDNYKKSVELMKNTNSETGLFSIQKTLLNRGTGDNEHYQFLRELALEHPISSILISVKSNSEEKQYITPLMLKSGMSMLDFLELGN